MATKIGSPGHGGSALPPDAPPGPSSAAELRTFRGYTYWSLVTASVFVIVLLTITGGMPSPDRPTGLLALVALAAVVVAFARLTSQHIPPRPDERPLTRRAWAVWAAVGGTGALALATVLVAAGEVWLWALAPGAVASVLVAGLPRPRRRTAVPVVVAVAAGVGLAIGIGRGDDPPAAYALAGAGVTAFWLFMTLASIWTWQVVVKLDEARRTAAALAVANERLRFAADLHDIQGHSLQVISLKAQLAGRLVHQDAAAAAGEMAAVQRLAAAALRDTRSVVEGYRRVSLDTELTNAAAVLGSAGIDARLHLDGEVRATALPESIRQLLGLVVREAVTNVLRHSAATCSDVTLAFDDRGDRVRLTVTNDGVDGAPATRSGGLGQLAGRLEAVGGRLTWRGDGERFEVRAEVPAGSSGAPTPEEGIG